MSRNAATVVGLPALHRRRAATGEPSSFDPSLVRWRLVQEAEDLASAAQRRDPVTLGPLPRPWTEALVAFRAALFADGEPPRTLVVALCERLADHLDAIIDQPRVKLKREHELVPLAELRVMDARCRRWYARQSGAAPLEKAGRRGRLMGVLRRQSVDVAENRVAAAVVHTLAPRAAEYLGEWGQRSPHHARVRAVERASRAFRRWSRHEVLGELRELRGSVRPTYALLRDTHYRAIWDVHIQLRNEDEYAQAAWDGLERTVRELEVLALHATLFDSFGAMVDGPSLVRGPAAGRSSRFDAYGPPAEVVCVRGGEPLAVVAHHADDGGLVLCVRSRLGSSKLALPRWTERDPLREHLRVLDDLIRSSVEDLRGAVRCSWARRTSRPHEAAVATPWAQSVFDTERDGRVAALTRTISDARHVADDFPGCAVVRSGPMLQASVGGALWDELRAGEKGAAAGILRTAFGSEPEWRSDRVFVVPEDLDVASVRLLSTSAPATRRLWLLPRSVACVLAAERARMPERVGVLCFGERSATLNVLEARHEGARAQWLHRPPRPLDAPGIDLVLETVLARVLEREGEAAEPDALQRACWLRTVASAPRERPRFVDVVVGSEWRRLAIEDADWDAGVNALSNRLRLDAPSLEDAAAWIVEGVPPWLDALRERLRTRLPGAVWFLDGPGELVRGAKMFLDRHRRGEPTYLEVLPRIELQVVRASNKMRVLEPILGGDEIPPGERRARRIAPFAELPAGDVLDVALPLRIEGEPVRARWRDERIRLQQPLRFDVEVAWVAGLGGLRIDFVPTVASSFVPRRTLDWERASDAAAGQEVRNVFPPAVQLGIFGAGELAELREAWARARTALGRRKNKEPVPHHLPTRLARAMPAVGWREPEDGVLAEWEKLADEIAVLAVWGIEGKLSKQEKKRLQALRLTGARESIFGGAGSLAVLRLAGGFGRQIPRALVDRFAAALPLLPRDQKGRRGLRIDDAATNGWLHSAGRVAATAGALGEPLVRALVPLGRELVDDPCARSWAWAIASALFFNPQAAAWLADDEVWSATEALLAMGASLGESRSELRNEIGAALLGLCRAREGREAQFGPNSEWTKRILGSLGALREHSHEEVKTRFRLASGRQLWPALEETLRGTREVLVEAIG